MAVYKCPVCGGKGLVTSDFYEYKDPYGFSNSAMPTLTKTCRSCGGRGIVFDTHGDQETFSEHYGCIPDTLINESPTYVPDACKNCPNHPSNGGSGFCLCTLGIQQVT